jgi:sRNA-binding protein
MPRATVSTDTKRVDLKTLPEGFVVLRRMSYGEKMTRQAEAAKMKVQAQRRGSKGLEGELDMLNEKVRIFEFAHTVVDHNLEDDTGRRLNLTNAADIRLLDPRIGEEIEAQIGEMNNFEEDDEDTEQGN